MKNSSRHAHSNATAPSPFPGTGPSGRPPHAWGVLLVICALAAPGFSAERIQSRPQDLLPENTIGFVSAPDSTRLRTLWNTSAQGKLFADPAMKPFTDRLLAEVYQTFLGTLEKELDLSINDLAPLLSGQLTFAVTGSDGPANNESHPGFLFLADSGKQSGQLRLKLEALQKRWRETGKSLRSAKLKGDIECTLLTLATNSATAGLLSWFMRDNPGPLDKAAGPAASSPQIAFAQLDSFLVVADSPRTIEEVLAKVRGGRQHTLAEHPWFTRDCAGIAPHAPLFGWARLKVLTDAVCRSFAGTSQSGQASALEISAERIPAILGLTGLQTLIFAFEPSADNTTLQFSIKVPETNRTGLVKLFAAASMPTGIPAFIPADALKVQRWRADCRQAWNTLEQMLGDLSPRFPSVLGFIIDSANSYARQKEPGFDIRTNLIGNLGNDVIRYQKAPVAAGSPASVTLIGSPHPQQLADALRSILVFFSEHASTPPQERQFLSYKIFSVPLSASVLALAGASDSNPPPVLHYAASSNYVALSTSPDSLEEYLRSSEKQPTPLQAAPALRQAIERIGTTNATLLAYEDLARTMRQLFSTSRSSTGTNAMSKLQSAAAVLPGTAAVAAETARVTRLADLSLLPPFEQVAKYFSFMVYACETTPEDLKFKATIPSPAGLK